jgi:hypothetical protein
VLLGSSSASGLLAWEASGLPLALCTSWAPTALLAWTPLRGALKKKTQKKKLLLLCWCMQNRMLLLLLILDLMIDADFCVGAAGAVVHVLRTI